MNTRKKRTPVPDARIECHGKVSRIIPDSDEASDWIEDNCQPEDWMWMGPALCVESRLVMPIAEAMIEDGLEVDLPVAA